MSDEQKSAEDEVFDQELSIDDLDAVAGGVDAALLDVLSGSMDALASGYSAGFDDKQDLDNSHLCSSYDTRRIYGGGGFPNCAATVEDGSWCGTNDACLKMAVEYKDMNHCTRAWR